MRVLIGGMVAESNAYVKKECQIQDFAITVGQAIADRLYIREIAEAEGVELIPSIFAYGAGAGCVSYDTFDYIQKQFLRAVRENQSDLDGMFFFLHGASNVVGLDGGSGDHSIVREIRKIVGPYMPIAVVCDPHGNVSQEHADNINVLRTFRHSPHTDRIDAHQTVFKALIDILKNPRDVHTQYRKVPILLGGERCVSTDEPLVSINKLLDQIEADPRILTASYHIGYLRHDSDKCGAGICVVPYTEADTEYAKQKVDEIYDFVWARHKDFHFNGYADEPDVALNAMLNTEGGPVFLTDSGDNVTAGAPGGNTMVLRQVLALDDFKGKNILFAGISDKPLCDTYLCKQKIGSHVEFEVGVEINELSKKVPLKGTLIAVGDLHEHYHSPTVVGTGYTVKLDDIPVTVAILNKPVSFAERDQYDYAGIDMDAYNFIIVKQGYLYPDLKAMAKNFVMSLTLGDTLQRTELLTYKKVKRPIYPLDNI